MKKLLTALALTALLSGTAFANACPSHVKKIDEALDRIDQSTYGICERCEEEIPYPRLKARPVTTLCINCKTLEEQEEKARR